MKRREPEGSPKGVRRESEESLNGVRKESEGSPKGVRRESEKVQYQHSQSLFHPHNEHPSWRAEPKKVGNHRQYGQRPTGQHQENQSVTEPLSKRLPALPIR